MAVDGELDETLEPIALRVVRRPGAEVGKQPDLHLRQRIDVWVAQAYRAGEDGVVLKQSRRFGDAQNGAA